VQYSIDAKSLIWSYPINSWESVGLARSFIRWVVFVFHSLESLCFCLLSIWHSLLACHFRLDSDGTDESQQFASYRSDEPSGRALWTAHSTFEGGGFELASSLLLHLSRMASRTLNLLSSGLLLCPRMMRW